MPKRMIHADSSRIFRDAVASYVELIAPCVEVVSVYDTDTLVEKVRKGDFDLVLIANRFNEDEDDGIQAIRVIRGFSKYQFTC